jgi:phosphatidylserine decarboxylase
MSWFIPSDYLQYDSVNSWFIRKIDMKLRPIVFPNDSAFVVSPADSRIIGFQYIGEDQEIWLKGELFSVENLVNKDPIYQQFSGNGTLLISRLSPQDYHRFHAPVSGTIRRRFTAPGEFQSVNADAVTSGNEILVKNLREIIVLETEKYGNVLIVAVGANCVGSIVWTVNVGETVSKGQELGYFQFGGSTVVSIFPSNRFRLNDDIQRSSRQDVEMYLPVGQIVGQFIQ